jgi:DNA-directed RNA polymerase specialized sigma24 family protein
MHPKKSGNEGANASPSYGEILADKAVDRAVRRVLVGNGWLEQDVPDGIGEVRLRAVLAFHRGVKPPETAKHMKAFCAKIARDYAVDCLRKKETRDRYSPGLCEDPDEHGPVPPSGEQRDPVDAARQLEVAAELFREGRMPKGGVDILEGVASGCSYKEVGADQGITSNAVQGRLKTMRKLFRRRIGERGIFDRDP